MQIESSARAPLIITDEPTGSQWLDMHRSTWRTGEQRLMCAVLEDAVNKYLQYRDYAPMTNRGRLYSEAKEWIFVGGGTEPFSFESICAALGLDPDWWRQRLQAIVQEGKIKTIRRGPITKNAQYRSGTHT